MEYQKSESCGFSHHVLLLFFLFALKPGGPCQVFLPLDIYLVEGTAGPRYFGYFGFFRCVRVDVAVICPCKA